MTDRPKSLELVCIGRTCVDLYGEQIGASLECTSSFQKYVGGSASNICIGAARLGVRTAMIARVGEEPFGRFVEQTFAREGIDTTSIKFDPDRLTALITLAIRKCDDFPRIFYYENAADMALSAADIDESVVASAKVLLVTGTHFSRPNLNEASRAALRAAKQAGRLVAFDIDYRPVLWGLTGHARGHAMYIRSNRVSEHLQTILPECDLVVGTQEEICIAGGSENLDEALRRIRSFTNGAIVCKRGAQGSIVYPDAIPDKLDDGISAMPFPVEVLNSTGAGDAYMAGFLYGWIRDHEWTDCCRFGNACGAMVVSRHGCSSAMPSLDELDYFLSLPMLPSRLWEVPQLEQLHWSTRRIKKWPELKALAFDHRTQFEQLAERLGADRQKITSAKELVARAYLAVAQNQKYVGAIIDEQYGADLLEHLTGGGFWLARPIEVAGVTPLAFVNGPNVGLTLNAWPKEQVVKCLVHYSLDMPNEARLAQESRVHQLFQACRAIGRELLLELLPPTDSSATFDVVAAIQHFYQLEIFPDWWKIENPHSEAVWNNLSEVIQIHDPTCRGIILLGKGKPIPEIISAFQIARKFPVCKGFAVGRSIFAKPIEKWMAGECDDEQCVDTIKTNFLKIIEAWDSSKPSLNG